MKGREAEEPASSRTLTGATGSILTLAAASYGAKPADDATVPTGFDPVAVALFESIVEGAYLVASADGVVDDEERRTLERVVTAACGGAVAPKHVAELIHELQAWLQEEGLERRIAAVATQITRKSHAREVLRIAALLGQASHAVSDVERDVLLRLAKACGLHPNDVDVALREVADSLAGASS
ncbi:TerB family tellurite resistance protein [Pendulispora albinea]|uniref:TerB family tellurite resistance protein n=1 Tax=Pendulispora albinea TaxID=2741071 RepID=A0ABZ2M9D5_9BACT